MQNQENWKTPTPDDAGKVTPPADDAQQMPLNMLTGGGDTGAEMFGTPSLDAAQRKGVPGMVVVLIVILAVGGGALWAMRMSGGAGVTPDKEAKEAETKIDETLKKLAATGDQGADLSRKSLDTFFEDPDKVVALFNNDPVKNQVALQNLAKNPFALEVAAGADIDVEAEGESADYQKAERVRKLKEELAGLKLQSVVSGSRTLAIVSGEVVKIGDPVGSFTVEAIAPHGVVLSAEGESFELKLPVAGDKGK